MKNNTLKYIIFLATIAVAGILLIQFFFLRRSYNYSEKQFKESVSVTLKEVVWQILQSNGKTAIYDSITPVEMISKSYYIVNVESIIDHEQLKTLLIDELNRHDIYTSFEFAIYNPNTEMMEQETLITTKLEEKKSNYYFATNEQFGSYFGIHFPNRSSYSHTKQIVWYLFTALLILVFVFFGYALSVIIRQRRLTEIQKNFINNLTHELKTPISSIDLAANVLHDKNIVQNPERLLKYANIIKEQNKRLSKNVEKVLNLASLEKNKIHLNFENIELNEFLQESIERFKQSSYGQNARITLQSTNKHATTNADIFHFNNLIMNILENAVKYCEQSPEIDIKLDDNGKIWQLSFADNGIGIDNEHRKHIFKKFYRVPTGNVHNVKGFGLGLDYVWKIVKAHNWRIFVDDNPERGSVFTIEIPHDKNNR